MAIGCKRFVTISPRALCDPKADSRPRQINRLPMASQPRCATNAPECGRTGLECFIGRGGCMPRKFATLGFVVVASLLAGCSSTSSDKGAEASVKADAPASASNAIPGRCDAGLGQFAIGKPASIDLLSQVRARTGSQDARILGPDDMVTLEYRSERVNVNTDASGKVTRINCG
ncbi:putative Lipoprotein [Pseudomonas syringae pv. daphniphylli]|uniref:Lipoprotein n=1 Tax=Pseudomonas syringae pv. daphniphylli TaxID=264455 RepID=A0A9X0H5T4_PSESX|nr:putative Lipoprotein [Pseudomonas syringae pv. daphniphylli]